MRATFLLIVATLFLPLVVLAKDPVPSTRLNRMAPVADISAVLFPKVNGQKPVFTSTDKIQVGYLDTIAVMKRGAKGEAILRTNETHPLPSTAVLFAEGAPYFRIQWQIPEIKRIALFNLDATRAGYQCCSTDSMEHQSCYALPALLRSFDFTEDDKTDHRVFRARHAFAAFDGKGVVVSHLMVRAQTVDGHYFERRIKLYYRLNSIHNRCSAQKFKAQPKLHGDFARAHPRFDSWP